MSGRTCKITLKVDKLQSVVLEKFLCIKPYPDKKRIRRK